MLSRNDAHHYRAEIKRRKRTQRISGFFLIAFSICLLFYAVPGFAVSVFDYDDQVGSQTTLFSQDVNDHAAQSSDAALTNVPADESVAPQASTMAMSEFVGPAMLENDAAVDSAKKRAQAMQVVSSSQNSMVMAKAQYVNEANDQPAQNLLPASIAFIAAIVCAILGIRLIMRSRYMMGKRIAAEYSRSLRAC